VSERRRTLGRVLRIAFGILGVLFMVIAFRHTWDRSTTHAYPRWTYVAGAEVLVIVGLAGASRGWVCLFEGRGSERALAQAFYTSQLGKYVPGAIWQAVGQVGLSRSADVSLAQATTAFPVHALTQVAAGGTIGATLAIAGIHLSMGVRLIALGGLVLVLPLRRVWMLWVLERITRLLKKGSVDDLPSQGAILRSYTWGIWTLLWSGSAFALLAYALDAASPAVAAVPAFAAAWTVGFLAVPFPSGIGVREAVLIATVSSPTGAGPVIVASVVHRLVTMLGELVMIVITKSRASLAR
jgi:hypothetical protein